MKLFDSEWKVMEVLWQQNDQTAKAVSLHLAQSAGWNKNTTYTVIKKCIDKGAIERREPNFVCHALISKRRRRRKRRSPWSTRSSAALPSSCLHPCCRTVRSAKRNSTGSRRWWRRTRDDRLQAAIVSGSALIVIIALLRAALRRHLPARLFPALWCVAAVRLLLRSRFRRASASGTCFPLAPRLRAAWSPKR